jgi:hypothetical protein
MDDDPAVARKRSIRRYRKSVFQDKNGHVPMKYKPRAPAPVTGNYQAQITKTVDGGATWKTVFNVSNQFYVRRTGAGLLCWAIVGAPNASIVPRED